MKLIRNVGRKDKNIRIAVGIALILIGLVFAKSFLLTVLGVIVLATGIVSFCWVYTLLGMNTASATEQTTASEDLSERAIENLEDFKEEAVETAGELKEKAEDAVEDFKESDLGKQAEEKIDELKEKAGDVVDDIKSGEFAKDAKEKLSELKEDASEFVDSAKDKIAKSRDNDPKELKRHNMQIDWAKSVFEPIVFAGRTYIVKRDDLLLPIGGNKARKLLSLSKQDLSAVKSVVSFGGAQSNAMLALAQFCALKHIRFDYYTRPVPKWLKQKPLGNLAHALNQGMHWHINRDGLPPDTLDNNTLLIPQGISMPEAEAGIKRLALEIEQYCAQEKISELAIALPSGTGATALYLQQHVKHTVYTVPCIGNSDVLMQFFKQQLPNAKRYPTMLPEPSQAFRFGEPHAELLSIYQALFAETGIEFELLYDAKAWLSLVDWKSDKPILYIHNGGVSGNASMLARYQRLGFLNDSSTAGTVIL